MRSAMPALGTIHADLLLLHPPAVFDFRGRRDIHFPFLGTSGDVPITPLYEYFPVGFKTLQRYLGQRDHDVRLLNLASLLLRYPHLDVDALFGALDVALLGIDLHWMVHVQGALAVAHRFKAQHPDVPIVLGGISSTYYAAELITYPQVDMVMTGYDTHEPLDQLLGSLGEHRPPTEVPNLWWKDDTGAIRDNGLTHQPRAFACGVDWSHRPEAPPARGLPIREILATQNAGCVHDCPWCGGSASAFRRIHQCNHSVAHKPVEEVRYELKTMAQRPGVEGHHYYAVGSYNQSTRQLETFLEGLARARVRSVSLEQFVLPSDDLVARLVAAHPRCTITLSPQSHDPVVARAAGRAAYTNDELEAWIDRALTAGVHGVDLWYFVGMPEQDERLVLESVDYCEHLLHRFTGTNVNPMICPMIPFLDPGSAIFEAPDHYGYRLFFRTLEEHRRGMERASLINRLNYETRWLSREAIIRVGFDAVGRLMEAKAEVGMIRRSQVERHNAALAAGLELLTAVHEADNLSSPAERQRQLAVLGDDIEKQNDQLLYGGVANQAFPIKRQPVGRWFDELCWPIEVLEATDSTP